MVLRVIGICWIHCAFDKWGHLSILSDKILKTTNRKWVRRIYNVRKYVMYTWQVVRLVQCRNVGKGIKYPAHLHEEVDWIEPVTTFPNVRKRSFSCVEGCWLSSVSHSSITEAKDMKDANPFFLPFFCFLPSEMRWFYILNFTSWLGVIQ